jgi:hypothetical protein
VHSERADKLFKRLRAAQLDDTYDEEMRKLHRVELLILDDLALQPLDAMQTSDFYHYADVGIATSWSWNATGTRPRSSPPTVNRRRSWP